MLRQISCFSLLFMAAAALDPLRVAVLSHRIHACRVKIVRAGKRGDLTAAAQRLKAYRALVALRCGMAIHGRSRGDGGACVLRSILPLP